MCRDKKRLKFGWFWLNYLNYLFCKYLVIIEFGFRVIWRIMEIAEDVDLGG